MARWWEWGVVAGLALGLALIVVELRAERWCLELVGAGVRLGLRGC